MKQTKTRSILKRWLQMLVAVELALAIAGCNEEPPTTNLSPMPTPQNIVQDGHPDHVVAQAPPLADGVSPQPILQKNNPEAWSYEHNGVPHEVALAARGARRPTKGDATPQPAGLETGPRPAGDVVAGDKPTNIDQTGRTPTVGNTGETSPSLEKESAAAGLMADQLGHANLAFNTPEKMKTREPEVVQLLLDLNKSIEELSSEIQAEGPRQGASVRVTRRMEAHLTGVTFEITPVTPEQQVILEDETTEWKWEVVPTEAGEQRLYLTVNAVLMVDGESTFRMMRTFDKVIRVKVAWGHETIFFLKDNMEWAWATLFIPIAGWVMQRRRKKREKTGPDDQNGRHGDADDMG